MSTRTASTSLSQVRLRRLVQDLATREHEWLSLVRYDLDRRWYQRLACDDDHEVWLLSWLPGQRTGSMIMGNRPARSRWRAAPCGSGPRRGAARARRSWCPGGR